jgi:hypothetical protein
MLYGLPSVAGYAAAVLRACQPKRVTQNPQQRGGVRRVNAVCRSQTFETVPSCPLRVVQYLATRTKITDAFACELGAKGDLSGYREPAVHGCSVSK